MISILRLPRDYDAARLRAEALDIAADYWVPHFVKDNYQGDWSAVALRCTERGLQHPILAVAPDLDPDARWVNLPLLDACPYTAELLSGLQCDVLSVRFLKLSAGSRILEHTDPGVDFDEGEVRLHVPVQSNDKVAIYIDKQPVPMREGELWYCNFQLPHHIDNHGDTDRIHLVIDAKVNDWMRELFEQALRQNATLATQRNVDAGHRQ